MFKFNKLRSGTRPNAQYESDTERGNTWSPSNTSKRISQLKKSVFRGDDLGHISDSELSLAQKFFPVKTPVTPVKTLQRSRHTIDTSLIPAVLDKYGVSSPRSPALPAIIASRKSVEKYGVSSPRSPAIMASRKSVEKYGVSSPRSPAIIASRKSVDIIREYPQKIIRKSWTTETESSFHSNGDSRRKSCDLVLRSRPLINGDSNRTMASDCTFGKSDNSGRSWTWDSSADDDEYLDRSTSSGSYRSHEDEIADEALEYAEAEEKFLLANGDYAETSEVENIRQDQYPKLSLHRHVYMDYANLALSSRFQMEEHMKLVMAEGHTLGTKSSSSAEYAASAQRRLLQMFNTSASEYSVVFTTGLKASYNLVANAYPFQKGSPILLCQDNHAAVRQLIAAAVKAGGKAVVAPLEETDLSMTKGNIRPLMKRHIFQTSGSLFVYPAQSSVTGIRHSMHWINKAHKSGWHVLLDASTLLPTGSVDLQRNQPDFVVGAFQNIVGYPSGMGFLLVRRTSFLVTHAPNSNAIALTPRPSFTQGKDCHIVAEDESLSKLSFAGLDLGLKHLQSIGLDVINKRVGALATWMVHKLKGLRHIDPDDWSLVNVYSPYMAENRGNIISFNILDSTGEVVPPALVQRLASRNQITLAVGSFNNPGVANLLGPRKERVKNASVFELSPGFKCVQVSLGPMSNFEDAYRVVHFLTRFRNPDYVSMALGFPEDQSLLRRRR